MDFKSLQRMAKNVIDKRGGTEALKADAEELKNIATGPGTASEKAKRAADALKDPGAKGPDRRTRRDAPPRRRPRPGRRSRRPPTRRPPRTPAPPSADTPAAGTAAPPSADPPKPPDAPDTAPPGTPAP